MPKTQALKRIRSPGRSVRRRTGPTKIRPPADVIKQRIRRPLSDSAGILSPAAVGGIRKAIEESRKERGRLDRERLRRLTAAFDRHEAAVLETARLKAKSAGLTRKEAQALLDQVKKEHWKRRYGNNESPR